MAHREQSAGLAYWLLEEYLIGAELRDQSALLHGGEHPRTYTAENHVHPARPKVINGILDQRVDRVGVAGALHAQDDDLGLALYPRLDGVEMLLQAHAGAEVHLALEPEDEQSAADLILAQPLVDGAVRTQKNSVSSI